MTFNKDLSAIGAIIFFIATCFAGCNDAPATEEQSLPSSKTNTSPAFTETAVKVHFLKKERFYYFVRSDGKVKSAQEQMIRNEIGGKLVMCKVRAGAFVSAGSLIAQFETTPILQKLERAELNRFNSEKEYASQLLGYENLLTSKSSAEADAIRKKLRISSGLSGAELDIKELNNELNKAFIRAPFSGILADIKVQQGEYIVPNQELMRIYNPRNLFLELKVLESDMAVLHIGIPAEITSVSNSLLKFGGSLDEMNPYVDADGLVLIRLRITNVKSDKIFPGMNCTAIIKVPMSETLAVPKEAIVMRNGKEVVFTVEDGKAKWNYVVTGRDNGTTIEIKEGLREGQKVITANNLQLAHDAPVKEATTQ